MYEDGWLEAAYEDRNGGDVDTAPFLDDDDEDELYYSPEEGGGCKGPCVPNFEGLLATCIHCHQPIN